MISLRSYVEVYGLDFRYYRADEEYFPAYVDHLAIGLRYDSKCIESLMNN